MKIYVPKSTSRTVSGRTRADRGARGDPKYLFKCYDLNCLPELDVF